jgi:class 3 adenylate cyclase/tetratricopeptide (TPR) repeat protein
VVPQQAEEATRVQAERRLVSVLFADLVEFTSLSESRDAEEVRELLSRYFDTCRRLVGLYGGLVEKFIGDAVMAVWGTPVATEDDAERAVRTALDLVAAVQALGQEAGAEGLRARAGVLTGEAAVNLAAVGEGMVAGDLVNTASRVQAAAEPGSVFVGEATRRATEGTVVYEPAGSFELKGKEGQTPLWRALRVVSGRAGALKSEGLEAPFVGRDRELRQIKDLFHVSAEEQRAQLVSVTGIAGIGKSRLAWEFYKYFDGIAQTVYWHRGRCLAYGEGVTYWALADMVRMRCRIAEDEAQQEALQKLQAALAEHLLDSEERLFVEPRLAQLLGLAEGPSHERQDLFAAWRLFFERLADTYPTVLAFEDMQWADSSLLDFVEYLLEWSRDKPLFVVTLARPELLEKRPSWGAGHRNFTSMYLEPLLEQAMRELLVGLVPGLPGSLCEQILGRAEGVPLYAVETVRMLLDRGLLVEDGSSYKVVGEIDTLEVPETLHALIAARLDGLSSEERPLLGDAAVLGKTFTAQALAALNGLNPDRLQELLTALVRREVLGLQSDPRSPEHGQYTFLQDLLRYVAYETLPKRERRQKHLAAAAYLAQGEDELAEVIAAHYVEAATAVPDADDAEDVRAKAHAWLVRAGERADSLGAPGEAQRYFEQAAELAPDTMTRARLLERAGWLSRAAADLETSERQLTLALPLYLELGDTHAWARASARLAHVERWRGRFDEGLERLEQAWTAISGDEPDEAAAFVTESLASAFLFLGRNEEAGSYVEIASRTAEALGDVERVCDSFLTRGMLARRSGRPEESRALFSHALALAREHDLFEQAGTACFVLSDWNLHRDRYEDSLDYLREALELAKRTGQRGHVWAVTAEMTYPLYMLGRWDEAGELAGEIPEERVTEGVMLSFLQTGVEINVQRGDLAEARRILSLFASLADAADVQERSCYLASSAVIARAEQRLEDALHAGAEAVTAGSAMAGLTFQSVKEALVESIEAALALGRTEQALQLIEQVEAIPPGLRSPFLDATAHRFRAHLAGNDPGADRKFAAAEMQLRAYELPFHLAVVQLEHGEWLNRQGRHADAQAFLTEARSSFERLKATPWQQRLDAIQTDRPAESVA